VAHAFLLKFLLVKQRVQTQERYRSRTEPECEHPSRRMGIRTMGDRLKTVLDRIPEGNILSNLACEASISVLVPVVNVEEVGCIK
jgi:hypothetical protein